MASVLERIPERVQAGLIDRVLASPHPKLALPTIASNAHMSLSDLQVVLNKNGYPDRQMMTAARNQLIERAQAAESIDLQAAVAVTTPKAAPKAAAVAPGERFQQVPVGDLHPDPENPREKILDTDVEDLADSIAEIGILQPIVARETPKGLVIVAGHRRVTALKLLGWTHAPVIIRSNMRPDHVLAAMLIENGQRRDLDPIEEARGLRRLKEETGCHDLELAKKVGRSQGHVSGRLALLLLSPDDQDRVRAGELGLTQGTNLGRLNGGKVRKKSKGSVIQHHFDVTHDLATHAGARCKRLGHKSRLAGGQACGACWESVIRADERDSAQKRHASTGTCPTCG